jgi:uncharacterized protein
MKINPQLQKSLWFGFTALCFSGVLFGIELLFNVNGDLQIPMYGPTLATLLFLWREKKDIGAFLRKSFTFRINLPILLTLLIPVVLTPVISYYVNAGVVSLPTDTGLIAFYLVAMFPAVMGEEIGWRGYLLPKLQERYTPFAASLILGLIWGFWHTPTKLAGITFFVFWFLQLMGGNFLGTFVYNKAKPSLWSAILLHYIFNMMGFLFMQNMLDVVVVTGIVYLVAGLLFVALLRKDFSARPAPNERE